MYMCTHVLESLDKALTIEGLYCVNASPCIAQRLGMHYHMKSSINLMSQLTLNVTDITLRNVSAPSIHSVAISGCQICCMPLHPLNLHCSIWC